MKRLFYLWLSVLPACNPGGKASTGSGEAPAIKALCDTCGQGAQKAATVATSTGKAIGATTASKANRQIVPNSLISFEDTLYTSLKPVFSEISEKEFELYKRSYKTKCALDTGNFIKGSGIDVSSHCNEICETTLAERNTNRNLLLPSDYDQGILAMPLAPNCTKFIVCSSSDGPTDGYRAAFYIFTITTGVGLKGIKPAFKYHAKNWSVDDLTWVDNKTIALKTYAGSKGGDNSGLRYRYFKAGVSK